MALTVALTPIARGRLGTPGTWTRLVLAAEDGRPERVRALVTCPRCGGSLLLAHHTIGEDGDVHPDVMHADRGRCKWTDWVRLEGWRG